MNTRSILVTLLAVLCAAALWGVVAQGRQLSDLRAEKKRLEAASQVTTAPATETVAPPSPTPEVPRELLQLRAEVARLSERKRELAGAKVENERLRLQLENRRTNGAAAKGTGAAYLRISEAKWVGYNTPEDTLQSFFWAAHNRDTEKLQESLVPEMATQFKAQILGLEKSAEEFFNGLPPVFAIVGREEYLMRISPREARKEIMLKVQIGPDVPPQQFSFREIGGQWKLEVLH